MLSPRYLDGLSDELVEIYSQLETDILQDMARRIKKLGSITDATKWQAQMLTEAGGLKANIAKTLKKYDKTIVEQVTKTYTEALKKNTENDSKIFVKALGRTVSAPNAQQMLATIQKCHSDLSRLTLTTAATSQTLFVQQANRVYMDVQSGAFDYDTAMKSAADAMAERGITTVQYENGRPVTRTIESAIRMNILTSINQTAANMTLNNCEELDCDLVETSAHIGARHEHEEWQGQIFSRSGKNPNYRPFSVCELGSVTGICGINCRHSFYPYFEGMHEHYTQDDLDEMAKEEVVYNGHKMPRYEAEQKLRGIERNIRKYKRRALTQEAIGVDNSAARRKIGQWQAAARDFTQQTGIARDSAREFIGTKNGIQPRPLAPKPIPTHTIIVPPSNQTPTTIQPTPSQQATAPQKMKVTAAAKDANARAQDFYSVAKDRDAFVDLAVKTQTMTAPQSTQVVNGGNLTQKLAGIKERTEDIKDIVHLQGFDGKPRVLPKDDFLKAVDDDTFIAQRTYTAPNTQVLNDYIKMLREGDFYVDCRVGGKAHGKGMYCAADFTKGKELKYIVDEMEHYQTLGLAARREKYTMTETLALDPTAKIIDEKDIISTYKKMLRAVMEREAKINGEKFDKILYDKLSEKANYRDVGVLAASMGYDAIRADKVIRSADYVVVLNRTKLIILGGN